MLEETPLIQDVRRSYARQAHVDAHTDGRIYGQKDGHIYGQKDGGAHPVVDILLADIALKLKVKVKEE